jgi:hypothetical protein
MQISQGVESSVLVSHEIGLGHQVSLVFKVIKMEHYA